MKIYTNQDYLPLTTVRKQYDFAGFKVTMWKGDVYTVVTPDGQKLDSKFVQEDGEMTRDFMNKLLHTILN